jgi:hypothetical protein
MCRPHGDSVDLTIQSVLVNRRMPLASPVSARALAEPVAPNPQNPQTCLKEQQNRLVLAMPDPTCLTYLRH